MKDNNGIRDTRKDEYSGTRYLKYPGSHILLESALRIPINIYFKL